MSIAESSTEIVLPGTTLRLRKENHTGKIDRESLWRRRVAKRCQVLMKDSRCPLHARGLLLEQFTRCHTGTVEDIDMFDKALYKVWPDFFRVWRDSPDRSAAA